MRKRSVDWQWSALKDFFGHWRQKYSLLGSHLICFYGLIMKISPAKKSRIKPLISLLVRRTFLFSSLSKFFMWKKLVGGGTAGSVLAARLSEISNWRILLVEAGGEQPSKVKIPWFHLWLPNTPLDWKYITEPQHDAMWAFEDQVIQLSIWQASSVNFLALEHQSILASKQTTIFENVLVFTSTVRKHSCLLWKQRLSRPSLDP